MDKEICKLCEKEFKAKAKEAGITIENCPSRDKERCHFAPCGDVSYKKTHPK